MGLERQVPDSSSTSQKGLKCDRGRIKCYLSILVRQFVVELGLFARGDMINLAYLASLAGLVGGGGGGGGGGSPAGAP